MRTFSTVPEAHVARSVLDAAGIPTLLADDNIIAADWRYSNAVGGVKLLVPEDRASEAVALLDTPAQQTEEVAAEVVDLGGDVCPKCGSDDLQPVIRGKRWTALTWLITGLPLIPVRRTIECRQCGTTLDADIRKPI